MQNAKSPSSAAKSSITYADAGVDISTGDRAKQRIKYLAQKTFNKQVLGDIGGFGGLFKLDTTKYETPVLVSSADGVGTKLKVAFELKVHHTVGADLVNHCVNDIAVQGAHPLFFLDYLATGRLDADITEKDVNATLAGMEQRRGNVSEVWAWLRSYDIGQDYAGRLFGDVQVTVMPKLVEHTPDQLTAVLRTMSFYARLSPGQRQALEREYEAIYERLGRPIRASTVAALVTARRSIEAVVTGIR